MVVSEEGQCFIALQRVRPGKVVACFDFGIQVDGTGLPAEGWWRWTRELMLGRSYKLAAW
jgi:hypothetical protein